MKPIRITHHAAKKAAQREIDGAEIEETVRRPDTISPAQPPRRFHQRRYLDKTLNEEMLLRVLIEETDSELVVVTLYKTSKFKKYAGGQAQ